MHPTLLSIGELRFHSYTVMLSLGFVLGIILGVRENYRRENPYPITPAGGIIIFFFALSFSRAWWILQYGDGAFGERLLHVYRAFYFWQSGLVYYGGFVGGFLGAVVYLKWLKLPVVPLADIVLAYLPFSQAIGRLGCFLNGCCWGTVTDLPWGLAYGKSRYNAYGQHLREDLITGDAAHSLPVHPTSIYAAIGLLAIFGIMLYASRRGFHKNRPGATALLYPLLYGILRFALEFVRGDNDHAFAGMTASQLMALAMALCAVAAYVVLSLTWWPRLRAAAGPADAEMDAVGGAQSDQSEGEGAGGAAEGATGGDEGSNLAEAEEA